MGTKQHYIPRFLIKNWSNDSKSVCSYFFKSQKYVENCPIRSQSQKSYFYGKDQSAEEWLSIIENQASSVISKLLGGLLDLNCDEKNILLFFLTIQLLRTPSFNVRANNVYSCFEKSFSPSFLQQFKKPDEKNSNTPEQNLLFFREVALTLFDLKLILLEANETNPFVLGQDPIFVINPLLSGMESLQGNHGLGLRGVVLCMPISPLKSICLYDQLSYYPSIHNGITELDDCDINLINKYQILKSDDYFISLGSSADIIRLASTVNREDRTHIGTHTSRTKYDEFINYSIREYEFPEQPLYLRIKMKAYMQVKNGTDLTRPMYKQMKNICYEKWGIPDSVTIEGKPVSK